MYIRQAFIILGVVINLTGVVMFYRSSNYIKGKMAANGNDVINMDDETRQDVETVNTRNIVSIGILWAGIVTILAALTI